MKLQEIVSDEARGDQWGVRSIDKVLDAAHLKERFAAIRPEEAVVEDSRPLDIV